MAVELDVAQAVLLRPGEGEAVADLPQKTLLLLVDHEALALTWFRYPAHEDGPERHIHQTHTDAFYVLGGEVSFRVGPDESHVVRGTAGTFVAAPPGVVHTFANESSEEVTFLNVHAPNAGFADMLRARRDGRHRDADRFDQHPPPADGGRPLEEAIVSLPGEGESIPGEHRDFVVKAELPELEVIDFTCEPEFGPVEPHIHSDKIDSFFVLEGELEFTLDDETVRVGPGSLVAALPGFRHGFRNPGPERARFVNIHAPSDGFIERVRHFAARRD
jgi:mannose-6-phosphate isomerase-like protein (cupin superfamily)